MPAALPPPPAKGGKNIYKGNRPQSTPDRKGQMAYWGGGNYPTVWPPIPAISTVHILRGVL